MKREVFDKIRIGQTVYFVTGPGQFPAEGLCRSVGTVTAKGEDKWGMHLAVLREDGCTETVSSIRTQEEKGVGAYI